MAEEIGIEFPAIEKTQLACKLMGAGRQTLEVYAPTLISAPFNDSAFVDATRRFALDHERAKVRLLVLVGGRLLHTCPNLVSLVQRLSSKIDFRVVDQSQTRDRSEFHELFMIMDRRSVLHQHGQSDSSVWLYERAPRRSQVLIDFFEPLWDEALGDPELRRLSL